MCWLVTVTCGIFVVRDGVAALSKANNAHVLNAIKLANPQVVGLIDAGESDHVVHHVMHELEA
jgi:hypothetical protein